MCTEGRPCKDTQGERQPWDWSDQFTNPETPRIGRRHWKLEDKGFFPSSHQREHGPADCSVLDL